MAIFPVETRYIIRKACISNLSAIHHSSPPPLPLSTKRKKGRERERERKREGETEREYIRFIKRPVWRKGRGWKRKGIKGAREGVVYSVQMRQDRFSSSGAEWDTNSSGRDWFGLDGWRWREKGCGRDFCEITRSRRDSIGCSRWSASRVFKFATSSRGNLLLRAEDKRWKELFFLWTLRAADFNTKARVLMRGLYSADDRSGVHLV